MLFFHLSELKYRSKIYDVKNIYLKSKYDEDILKKLNIFLKKLDSKLLYGDLLELLDFTKYFILLNKRNEYKKVLILKKEVNLGYFADLEKKLQGVYPNFIFKVKPYAYINLLKNIDLEYDFILSDMNLNINLKYILSGKYINCLYN